MDDKEFAKEWKKEVHIPEAIWKEYKQTLEHIDDLSAKQEQKKIKQNRRWKQKKKSQKIKIAAAVLIIFLASGTIFCYANPAIASKFPLIGTIFWQIEDHISFPGIYSDFHRLSANDLEKSVENIMQEKRYSVTDNDITITASEIYCDGYSVYLTVKIEDTKGRFKNIGSYIDNNARIDMYGETESRSSYKIGKEEEVRFARTNINLEGKVIDDNTYIGMFKLDRKNFSKEAGDISLDLYVLSYTNNDARTVTEIEGEWNLTVPYIVNADDSKLIEINQQNQNQIGVKKIIITPYQLVVFCEKPGNRWLGCKAFSEDGELESKNTQREEAGIFALNNQTIKTLRLYLLYNPEDGFMALDFIGEKEEEKVKEMCDFYIEIPIDINS